LVIFILTESRTLGGLLGLATGDALGAPVEGLTAPPVPVRDMTGGGPRHREAGRITDDTLQALAVARSLIERHGFDPADLMSRLVHVYQRNPEFFGPTSTGVFEKVLRGIPPNQAARHVHEAEGSRSNGSVMRGPPIGLYYRDAARVREVSLACSRLTHYDTVAGECSAVMNVMISLLSRGAAREHALRDALLACGNEEVRGMLSRYWKFPVDPSLDALLATHASISLFLTAGSFEEALIAAVNQGGDADTVGALTGALAGAYWGVESIPLRWVYRLQDAESILQMAYSLWKAAEH
jgi:ADP-ribosyl-[dinitrogen reductase] hydrolase